MILSRSNGLSYQKWVIVHLIVLNVLNQTKKMKSITLTIKQLWCLKIIFKSAIDALEKGNNGYYVNNKKFFLALNAKEYRSLIEIDKKL